MPSLPVLESTPKRAIFLYPFHLFVFFHLRIERDVLRIYLYLVRLRYHQNTHKGCQQNDQSHDLDSKEDDAFSLFAFRCFADIFFPPVLGAVPFGGTFLPVLFLWLPEFVAILFSLYVSASIRVFIDEAFKDSQKHYLDIKFKTSFQCNKYRIQSSCGSKYPLCSRLSAPIRSAPAVPDALPYNAESLP